MAKFTPQAQNIIDRISAAAEHYGEHFDHDKVVAAMTKHYKVLGLKIPKVVYIENWQQAFSAARDAARDAAWDAAWGAAWGAAWSAAGDAARDAARDAACDAACGAAWSAACGAAWSAARDAACGAAWSAAWGAAWSAAWSAAAANTNADPKILHFLEIELPTLEALEAGLGLFFPMRDQLIITPVPKFRMNKQNMLHSSQLKALEWPDGTGYYYLNGVKFPEDLFKKVTSGKMPFQEILAIEDTDQRTQAMRFGDVKEFIKHAKGEKLDEFQKMRLDGTIIHYELYKFPRGDIFTKDAYYMIYEDVVPESDKRYMSGVPETKSVPEAMAWKFNTSEDNWRSLVPGVTMN